MHLQRTNAEFGPLLKTLREKRGVSQSRLAEKAEFDHSYVSRLESGARMPTREAVIRLADAMALPDDDRADLMASAGFLSDGATNLLDPDCVELAKTLIDVEQVRGDRERGEWIRATVRNLIAMNAA